MTISTLFQNNLATLLPSDEVGKALLLMDEFKVEQLAVVQAEQYMGMVQESTLNLYDESDLIQTIPFNLPTVFLRTNQHIFETLPIFDKHETQLLAVLDENDQYVGVLSKLALLENLSTHFQFRQTGAIVVLSMLYRDYSLSEISRLVESNNLKILATTYTGNAHDENNPAQLTLKLNQTDVSALLATFERFGYTVESVYAHQAIANIEQERYDLLMKYLSI